MSLLSTLSSNKSKIFYAIAGSFIVCFALVYLRSYNAFLYDLLIPINPQLDMIQTAVADTLAGNPMAMLSVIATPLTVLVAVVRIASTKLSTVKDQVSTLTTQATSQILNLQNESLTEIQKVTAVKEDYADKFQSTFTELTKTLDLNKVLLSDNSALLNEVKLLKEQLIAIDSSI